jgi:hypothetical protein
MLKGFAITPNISGRISIGEIVDQGGKRLPKKLDHIVITKNHQRSGIWAAHPEMESLIQQQKAANAPHSDQLRSIPVRIMFDRPENNFRAEYTCFDDKGRPICSGNGEKAKRRDGECIGEVACPGADTCEFGHQKRCKPFARLIVGMESSFENDPLSGFMFRTTSYNSIRSNTYMLNSLFAATGGKLAGMPCNLVMKAKSTAASHRTPVYYLALEPRGGLLKAAQVALEYRDAFTAAGLNRDDLEESVAKGLAQSAFYESGDDGVEIVEEFFPVIDGDDTEIEKGDAGTEENLVTGDQQQNLDPLVSKEQVKKVEDLLDMSGKDQAYLLNWLGKSADTGLFDLTPEEIERSIQVLTNLTNKSAAPSIPQQQESAVVMNTEEAAVNETQTAKIEVAPAEVTDNTVKQTIEVDAAVEATDDKAVATQTQPPVDEVAAPAVKLVKRQSKATTTKQDEHEPAAPVDVQVDMLLHAVIPPTLQQAAAYF